MKITLEINEKQYKVLLESLDLYGRLLMGQTEIVAEKLANNGLFGNQAPNEKITKELKKSFFPELAFNQYYGIAKTCKNSQIALEMYSNLRYNSGKDQNNVWGNKPMNFSGEQIEISFE